MYAGVASAEPSSASAKNGIRTTMAVLHAGVVFQLEQAVQVSRMGRYQPAAAVPAGYAVASVDNGLKTMTAWLHAGVSPARTRMGCNYSGRDTWQMLFSSWNKQYTCQERDVDYDSGVVCRCCLPAVTSSASAKNRKRSTMAVMHAGVVFQLEYKGHEWDVDYNSGVVCRCCLPAVTSIATVKNGKRTIMAVMHAGIVSAGTSSISVMMGC